MRYLVIDFMRRVTGHFRKKYFIKTFAQMSKTSGFGIDDLGKACMIAGRKHMYIGSKSYFGGGCEFICLESHFEYKLSPKLVIGNNVKMTSRCRITCAGTIEIGDDVLFAPEVFVTDHNHGMDPTIKGGYSGQRLIVKDVSIGEGTWCGQRVCILPGVTIGKHCIIGAGSIVTHSIPDYSMAAGNPAVVLKKWNSVTGSWEKV